MPNEVSRETDELVTIFTQKCTNYSFARIVFDLLVIVSKQKANLKWVFMLGGKLLSIKELFFLVVFLLQLGHKDAVVVDQNFVELDFVFVNEQGHVVFFDP